MNFRCNASKPSDTRSCSPGPKIRSEQYVAFADMRTQVKMLPISVSSRPQSSIAVRPCDQFLSPEKRMKHLEADIIALIRRGTWGITVLGQSQCRKLPSRNFVELIAKEIKLYSLFGTSMKSLDHVVRYDLLDLPSSVVLFIFKLGLLPDQDSTPPKVSHGHSAYYIYAYGQEI